MTLAQIYLDMPEIKGFYERKYEEQVAAGEKMRQRVLSLSKNHHTDSPRDAVSMPKLKESVNKAIKEVGILIRREDMPKLKNMSRCKAWKEEYD